MNISNNILYIICTSVTHKFSVQAFKLSFSAIMYMNINMVYTIVT